MVTRLFLVSLLLVNSKSVYCNSEVVYVTPYPPPNLDCHDGLPCQTLKNYLHNKTLTQQSINLTMIFLPGEHVGVDQRIALKSTSFTVSGAGKLGVTIKDVSVELQYATAIRLEKVTLGHWNISSPSPPYLVFQMLSVLAENQTHIFIEHAPIARGNMIRLMNSVFRDSSLSGILLFIKSESNEEAISVTSSTLNIGRSTNVTFIQNQVHVAALRLNLSTLNIASDVCMTFADNSKAMAMFNSTLNVMSKANMTFIHNSKPNDEGVAMFVVDCTLNIESDLYFINNSAKSQAAINLQRSILNIRNSARINFINNSASTQAGAILVEDSRISVEDSSKMTFIDNSAGKIGAMAILSSELYVRNETCINFISNSAQNSKFSGAIMAEYSRVIVENNAAILFTYNSAGSAGAMTVQSSSLNVKNDASLTFEHNSADTGGAIFVLNSTIDVDDQAKMTFLNNSAFVGGAFTLVLSVLHFRSRTIVNFINNSALSVGGALLIHASQLIMENATNMSLRFVQNSAVSGGAMALLLSTLKFISGDTSMTFMNNSAKELGGAIYVDPDLQYLIYITTVLQYHRNYSLESHCLYETDLSTTEHNFYFINNSATIAGTDVYGASLTWCNGSHVHTVPKNTSLSSISGDPTRVCICENDNEPKCQSNHISFSLYPGDTIAVSLVVVGGDGGATTGIVYARFRQPYSSSTLKPYNQHHQLINTAQCTALNFSVYSKQSVQLVLSAHSYSNPNFLESCDRITKLYNTSPCKIFSPLYTNLTFLPCPPGFFLQGDPPGCECYPVLTDNGVECNIFKSEATLSWNTSLWITISSSKISFSKHCPFDYCKDTKFIKQRSDDECAFNRAGRLCGNCKENYSLAIGSSHCIYCSNDYNLALLIFFAAAGFLLVLFISILNLTVTQGMINGLIFYANIVWTYQSILFPNQIPSRLIFFKTFIAWLNLDFGIETCFLKNLNTFWKSLLQFVFPFYLWSIAGLMVVLARHSTRLTIFFGNRAVPVLATLILLSYMKLLRITVEALHFSILTVYDSTSNVTTTTSLVWSVDGTLDYFGYPHILLFVAALFTLLFLWLPYTLLLLFIQWIRRISHYCLLKWTTRFNPFYDANFAPLKHRHQYWFGVLLLARGIILVSFAANFSIPRDINLLILLIFAGVLLFYMFAMRIYKSHALLVFQSSFFLNLCFFSGIIIFSHTKSKVKSSMQTSAAVISIGVAFLQFCCIILNQIYLLCRSCGLGRSQSKVQANEELSHAILDISSRLEDQKYSAEKQPLMDPNQSDSDAPTN